MYETRDILDLASNYFEQIGVNRNQVAVELDENEFSNGFITNLASVNVVRQNRPLSNSKQTHIHITGPSMQAFFPLNFINSVVTSTEDTRIDLKIFNFNISHLTDISHARRSNTELPNFRFNNQIELLESSTVKKISARTGQAPQVQISKKRMDGQYFKDLRSGLFVDDLLIFLQYRNSPNEYLVMGIPLHLISIQEDISFTTDLITNSGLSFQNNTSVQEDFQFSLRNVTSDNIANYVPSSSEEHYSRLFDLSSSIENLSNRTNQHQQIVRQLARFLEEQEFVLYAGNIDCLATKENQDSLLFEVKTLNGTPTDETNQVRNALSQLLYYEEFATAQFVDTTKRKIALFESKVSDMHIEFLNSFGIHVMWLENESFTGNDDVIQLISSIIIC